jgi:hypothetical protein
MMHRRDFHRSLLAGGAAAFAARAGFGAETPVVEAPRGSVAGPLRGRAESCIFLWLGGGMCHVDTFDPKTLGDPVTKKAGSAYPAIPSAIRDVQVCEHLKRTADLLDRGIVLRTCFHDQNEEHARPTNLFKTGRPTSDTIIYPSIGSIISHERGPRTEGVPPYVVMGYPNVTRGPGFLGAKYGYIYLTDTDAGPAGLRRPDEITDERSRRRLLLLDGLREQYRTRTAGDDRTADYDAVIGEAQRLGGPEFLNVFDLKREPDAVRNRFGDEFGQRCLLARRLVQTGVRYVEVSFNLNFINGTGWDTHTHGQKEQHKLIQSLDVALSALLEDLEKHKLLDSTLVVLATEFGRPPEFDGGGGRGHQASTFSTVLFGGGLKTGQVVGQTDELGKKPLTDPISLPDWHATIHAAMGIDPAGELYAGDRPVPITDYGKPIARLFG